MKANRFLFLGNVLNCRGALAHEMGEGAAQPRVRALSCVSTTDSKGKLGHYLLLALLAFAASAVSLSAQTNSPVRRPDGGGQGGFANRLMQGPDRAMLTVLTDDQRNSFRQAMELQREKLRDLENKMNEARKDLMAASTSATFDENAVRVKAAYIGNIEVEMAVLRARAMSQIKPPLTADQIDRMKNFSAAGDLPVRPRDAVGNAGGNSSVHPVQRLPQRDENDLPAPAKP